MPALKLAGGLLGRLMSWLAGTADEAMVVGQVESGLNRA